MVANDLKLVTEQEAALAARLRAENPLFDLYLKVRETRQQLESKQPKATSPTRSAPSKRTADSPPPQAANGSGSNRVEALKIAESYLRGIKKRAKSGEICRFVQQRGITIPGQKASKRMAAYLSGDKRFNNGTDARGEGYGLSEWA